MKDMFKSRDVIPMKMETEKEPFDSEDYIFELKLDGIRCLAYLDRDNTQLINLKLNDLTVTYPELNNIHKQAKERCIIDGEIICLNHEGTPDFALLQTRSLLTDPFKIDLKMRQIPANFVAFDILYIKDKNVTKLTLMERKKLLSENISENEFLFVSRYIEKYGKKFYESVAERNLEGIIAKLKDSTYQTGKRTKSWFKIKNLIDEDFVICGYTFDKEKRIKYLILGQYYKDKLVYSDKVYLPRKILEERFILRYATKNSIDKPLFNVKIRDKIYWIRPNLVCTVSYILRTEHGNMRQPLFKALRDDKDPLECTKTKW